MPEKFQNSNECLVDVVVPLFNKEDSIERCLNSIFSQSIPPRNIIVVNDGSTDSSLSIARRLVESTSYPLLIVDQDNGGVSVARNNGIKTSGNEYICFLDADDEWHPQFIEKILALITDYPDADLYCMGHVVAEAGKSVYLPRHGLPEGFRGLVDDFFGSSSKGSVANSSKICVRREAMEKIGGFPSGVTIGEDLLVWMLLALNGKVACDTFPAVTVHREFDLNRQSRNGLAPYPLIYFGAKEYKHLITPSLKRYLLSIGIRHVIGSISENDRSGAIVRAKAIFAISPLYSVLAFALLVLPSRSMLYIREVFRGKVKS